MSSATLHHSPKLTVGLEPTYFPLTKGTQCLSATSARTFFHSPYKTGNHTLYCTGHISMHTCSHNATGAPVSLTHLDTHSPHQGVWASAVIVMRSRSNTIIFATFFIAPAAHKPSPMLSTRVFLSKEVFQRDSPFGLLSFPTNILRMTLKLCTYYPFLYPIEVLSLFPLVKSQAHHLNAYGA